LGTIFNEMMPEFEETYVSYVTSFSGFQIVLDGETKRNRRFSSFLEGKKKT